MSCDDLLNAGNRISWDVEGGDAMNVMAVLTTKFLFPAAVSKSGR